MMPHDPDDPVGVVGRPRLSGGAEQHLAAARKLSPHGRLHGCGLTKTACEQVRREAYGRCVQLVDEDTACSRWATDEINGVRLCEQHAASLVRAEVELARRARKKAELRASIDSWIATEPQRQQELLAWVREHAPWLKEAA